MKTRNGIKSWVDFAQPRSRFTSELREVLVKSIWLSTRHSLATRDTLITCYLLVRPYHFTYKCHKGFVMLFISPRILPSNNTIQVAPIQFNYGVFPGSCACVSMLQPLGRTGMLGPLVLISEPLMQRLMPSRSRSWYTCHWFIWYSFQNSYI